MGLALEISRETILFVFETGEVCFPVMLLGENLRARPRRGELPHLDGETVLAHISPGAFGILSKRFEVRKTTVLVRFAGEPLQGNSMVHRIEFRSDEVSAPIL